MRSYTVTLNCKMPMIHHADNIEWADVMDRWKNEPSNKKFSKAGDDRTPAFRWLGHMYHDDNVVSVPSDNLMRAFMEGGAMVLVPGGKSGKTFKAQTQSGMLVEGTHWPLLLKGKSIPVAPLLKLESEREFDAHKKAAEKAGFSLFVKRVKVGSSKHVRVRPLFENWSTTGRVLVWDDQITTDVLSQVVTQAGLYKGLGDWRPSGRTPGSYGTFTATITEN